MNIEWDWVKSQLKQSKTTQQLSTSVERLLETLETMRLFDDDALREVLDKFHKLALGHAIYQAPDERWVQCRPGDYAIGNTIRVKLDAYDGTKGTKHNGKRGRVVAIRGAKAVVLYDDAASIDEQYYHDPEMLERLV